MCTRAASIGRNGLPGVIDQPRIQGDNAMKRKTGRAGFTLIEMIVVIAIIAVLIALVAPLMTKYIATAKETRYRAAATAELFAIPFREQMGRAKSVPDDRYACLLYTSPSPRDA